MAVCRAACHAEPGGNAFNFRAMVARFAPCGPRSEPRLPCTPPRTAATLIVCMLPGLVMILLLAALIVPAVWAGMGLAGTVGAGVLVGNPAAPLEQALRDHATATPSLRCRRGGEGEDGRTNYTRPAARP